MINLLKAEFYKLVKDRSIWIILLVITASSAISIFMGIYKSADNAFTNLSKDIMPLLLALSIYSVVSLFKDFQNRTIIYYIISGHKRLQIVVSQFIRYFTGCVILIFAYPMLFVLIACVVDGYEFSFLSLLVRVLKTTLMQIPLYMSFIGFFFMIIFIIQQGVFAMGVSFASTILIVIFTNKLYFGGMDAVSSIVRFLPSIQLQTLSSNVIIEEYVISSIISIVLLGISFFFAYRVFDKVEIK